MLTIRSQTLSVSRPDRLDAAPAPCHPGATTDPWVGQPLPDPSHPSVPLGARTGATPPYKQPDDDKTVVVTMAVLFAPSGSGSLATTLAMLVSVPPVPQGTPTWMVTVALAPLARVP